MKLRNYIVTWQQYRETWSGHDQCDGQREEIFRARSPRAAEQKMLRKHFSGSYSHSIWPRNITVERQR